MGKGSRNRKARERPAEKLCTGFPTENYRILKWSAMLTLGIGSFGTMFHDVTGLGDIGRHVMESIGYISVPLYAFLQVKSFHYTKSKSKHLWKIFLLALFSFIPFSMMKTGSPFALNLQSACVTALIGFICLWLADRDFKKPFAQYIRNRKFLQLISGSARGLIAGTGAVGAYFLHAENGLYALPMLMILDSAEQSRHKKFVQGMALAVWCLLMVLSKNFYALTALIALFPIYFLQDKAPLFQCKESRFNQFMLKAEQKFYPAHLLIMMIAKIIALAV